MDTTIPWIRDTIDLARNVALPSIPPIFHMIWIGENPIPDHVIQNYNLWKSIMPHWGSKLWKNEDINQFPQEVIDKVNQANKGAQKADILRYYILQKYGGFYIDTDIIPSRSLDALLYMGYELILYHDNDLTWNYIINCFMGCVPNHPVVNEACKRVLNAELNTEDVNFKTGPYLWGTCVSEVPPKNGKKYLLLDFPFFSNFHNPIDKLGTHTYAASWVNK